MSNDTITEGQRWPIDARARWPLSKEMEARLLEMHRQTMTPEQTAMLKEFGAEVHTWREALNTDEALVVYFNPGGMTVTIGGRDLYIKLPKAD